MFRLTGILLVSLAAINFETRVLYERCTAVMHTSCPLRIEQLPARTSIATGPSIRWKCPSRIFGEACTRAKKSRLATASDAVASRSICMNANHARSYS